MNTQPETSTGWRELDIAGFMNLIGPLLSRRAEGGKVYGLRTSDRHANVIGSVHGGVLTSLLDQVIAIEAWTAADRRPTVTVEMDTKFTGAARPGDFLEATARIRHATRSLLFVEAEISRGETTIAIATAVMKITGGGN